MIVNLKFIYVNEFAYTVYNTLKALGYENLYQKGEDVETTETSDSIGTAYAKGFSASVAIYVANYFGKYAPEIQVVSEIE